MRCKEAAKIYNLGLKEFIDAKLSKVKLGESTVDKLKNMLLEHHANRMAKIKLLKKMVKRIQETDYLINRYQTSCFKDSAFMN